MGLSFEKQINNQNPKWDILAFRYKSYPFCYVIPPDITG